VGYNYLNNISKMLFDRYARSPDGEIPSNLSFVQLPRTQASVVGCCIAT